MANSEKQRSRCSSTDLGGSTVNKESIGGNRNFEA